MRGYSLISPLSFFEDLDRNFSDLLEAKRSSHSNWSPLTHHNEAENHYYVSLDIPGVSKDQLNIELIDNLLTITGERESRGQFSKSFQLPSDANLELLEANHQDGVLEIVIPKIKVEDVKRSIPISSGRSKFLTQAEVQTDSEQRAS